MEVIQTEDPRFVRDLHSKALLNTDRVSLENFRQRKITFARQEDEWNSIKIKVEELNILKDEMMEIKDLLRQLLSKKEL
jgi:hypothetical protein